MRDLTFYLAKTPPLPLLRLDVDIGTLLQTNRNWSTLVRLRFSHPPETQIAFGQDRLTEVGYGIDGDVFQALLGFFLSMCYSILEHTSTTVKSLAVLRMLASCLHCHSTTETLNLSA